MPGAVGLPTGDGTNMAETVIVDVPADPDLRGLLAYDQPEARNWSGELALGAAIWLPVLLVVVILWILELPLLAAVTGLLGMVGHAMLRPRIALYSLAFLTGVTWLVDFGRGFFTTAKVMGVVAMLVSLPAIFRSLQASPKDPGAKWMLVFVLWALILVPLSPVPLLSLIYWVTLGLVWSLPLLFCLHLKTRSQLDVLLGAMVASAVIMSVMYFLGVGQSEAALEMESARVAVTTEIGTDKTDINEAARIMSLGLFGAMFLFVEKRGLFWKGLLVVLAMIIGLGIVLTKTRACYLFVPLSVLVGLLFQRSGDTRKRLAAVVGIALGVGAILFIGSQTGLLGRGIQERLASIFQEGTEAGGRRTFWAIYAGEFARRGGLGGGIMSVANSQSMAISAHMRAAAHNDIVQIGGDLGLVGLACFFGLFIHLFLRVRKMMMPWHQLLALTILLFLLGAGLSQTDFYRKYYGLALSIVFVTVRLDEEMRASREDQVAPEWAAASPS
jgi:O-antigen ligase